MKAGWLLGWNGGRGGRIERDRVLDERVQDLPRGKGRDAEAQPRPQKGGCSVVRGGRRVQCEQVVLHRGQYLPGQRRVIHRSRQPKCADHGAQGDDRFGVVAGIVCRA
ncbi:hypothetical protein D3C72_1974420 [compost metagenome]